MKNMWSPANRELISALLVAFSTVYFIFNVAANINTYLSFRASAGEGVEVSYPVLRMIGVTAAAYVASLACAVIVRNTGKKIR